jgi:predicted nucleotidyltransferase
LSVTIRIDTLLTGVRKWAARDPRVRAVILVGSQARGAAGPDSDVDLVIVTESPAQLVADRRWVDSFGPVERRAEEHWGLVHSLRLWYRDGPEVEFGIAAPEWLAEPLDPGTRDVLRAGYRILFDRVGDLEASLPALIDSREA